MGTGSAKLPICIPPFIEKTASTAEEWKQDHLLCNYTPSFDDSRVLANEDTKDYLTIKESCLIKRESLTFDTLSRHLNL